MPELPEVETIARTLSPAILNHRIAALRILHPKVMQAGAELADELPEALITRVFRRAKLLLITAKPSPSRTAPELTLAFHLKMTGSFFVHPPETAPLKHTRLIIDLEDARRIFFDDVRTFGYCRIMPSGKLAAWDFWQSLGPEPLEGSARELAEHFARAFSGSRMAVKAALLDQRRVAGVGNIYADEALFKAHIHPAAPAGTLPSSALLRLAEALRATLLLSISECGSSIRNYTDALGNAGAFQNNFAVYGRKGGSCNSCGKALEHTRIAGRGTVFCPACQKR